MNDMPPRPTGGWPWRDYLRPGDEELLARCEAARRTWLFYQNERKKIVLNATIKARRAAWRKTHPYKRKPKP